MRKFGLLAVLTVIAGLAYAAWPLLTAYQIRHAVKTGDSATLERKVVWPRVRESLKASIAEMQTQNTEAVTRHGQPKPSLWSRVKSSFVPYFADNMIDKYVTAEGIANIDSLKVMWRQTKDSAAKLATGDVAAVIGESSTEPQGNAITRFIAFYNRISRARFDGLDKVEFEVADRHVPERRYISRFELADMEWKLVSVRVAGIGF